MINIKFFPQSKMCFMTFRWISDCQFKFHSVFLKFTPCYTFFSLDFHLYTSSFITDALLLPHKKTKGVINWPQSVKLLSIHSFICLVRLLHAVAFPSGANYPAGGLPQHMFACYASLTPLIAIQGSDMSENDSSCCLEGGGRSRYPFLPFLPVSSMSYSVSTKLIDFFNKIFFCKGWTANFFFSGGEGRGLGCK